MIAYSPSFWRHTVTIYPRTDSTDPSLGPVGVDGVGFTCPANVQGNPRYGNKHDRQEHFGGTQSVKGWIVYLKPTPGMPEIEAETRIVWRDTRLIAIDSPDDRGGYGVCYLVHCLSIQ